MAREGEGEDFGCAFLLSLIERCGLGSRQLIRTRLLYLLSFPAFLSFPSQLTKSLAARINQSEQDRASQRATQEDLDRTRREADKLTAKAKIVAGGGGTSKELELQEDRDKLYVCSSFYISRQLVIRADLFEMLVFHVLGDPSMFDVCSAITVTLYHPLHA